MPNKILASRSLNTDLASLLLRLIIGGFFIYYGYQKVDMYNQYSAGFPDYIGIGGKWNYNLVIFAELICGFLVLIGLFTRLAIIPIFITMTVAYFVAHKKDPFEVKQIALLYWFLCSVVFVLGSGKYSADAALFKK